LLSVGQIAPIPLVPLQPPLQPPIQNLEYHFGIASHNIDGCLAFKKSFCNL
jgi:hypothetical protein